jgi:hypothetical protein
MCLISSDMDVKYKMSKEAYSRFSLQGYSLCCYVLSNSSFFCWPCLFKGQQLETQPSINVFTNIPPCLSYDVEMKLVPYVICNVDVFLGIVNLENGRVYVIYTGYNRFWVPCTSHLVNPILPMIFKARLTQIKRNCTIQLLI